MNFETLNYIYKLLTDNEDLWRNKKEKVWRDYMHAEEYELDYLKEIKEAYEATRKEWCKALDALNEFKNKQWN